MIDSRVRRGRQFEGQCLVALLGVAAAVLLPMLLARRAERTAPDAPAADVTSR